jgi:hypothetical protein
MLRGLTACICLHVCLGATAADGAACPASVLLPLLLQRTLHSCWQCPQVCLLLVVVVLLLLLLLLSRRLHAAVNALLLQPLLSVYIQFNGAAGSINHPFHNP